MAYESDEMYRVRVQENETLRVGLHELVEFLDHVILSAAESQVRAEARRLKDKWDGA